MKRLLVFDFDGVLAIKYSMPEECYQQIPELLKQLSKTHILCVASYNPRAQMAIKSWGLDQYFSCMRFGANHTWKDEYQEHYRELMSKSDQIVNMIENEIKELDHQYSDIVFFDDSEENLKCVNEKLPHVKTVLVKDEFGFRLNDIPI